MEKGKAESLRREAEKAGLRKGKKIEVFTITDLREEGKRKGMQRQKGTVLQLFEHIFFCDMGRYKECFRYNEFLGNEAGRKVRIHGL